MKKSSEKVLVIGLDSAEPSLLFPWAKKGKLPNLAKIIEEGVSGNLSSTFPPMTAPAWTSFMTGKNPGSTGVFDFVQRIPGKYETAKVNPDLAVEKGGVDFSLITANMIRSEKIWGLISKANKKVGILHMPMSYPPEEVNGFLVSGLGAPGPESEFTYPAELREKLINEYGYKMHVSILDIDGREDEALEDLFETEEKRKEVAIKLMNDHDWDFFMVVFEGMDYVSHFFWKFMDPRHPHHDPEKAKKYKDAIFKYYQKADSFVGEILKNVDEDTTVVLMSDHGGGPVYKNFFVNQWLMDLGLLKLREKPRYVDLMAKLGFNIEKIYPLLVKTLSAGLINKIPKNIRKLVPLAKYTLQDFDWSRTKAFSVTGWGMIYINLKGREPRGIVEPGKEYEELRNFITEKLYELHDPETGEKCVEEVFKKEEVYSGQYFDQAPDLGFRMEGIECLDFILSNNTHLFIDSDKRKSGTHRKEGLMLIKGKGIKKGVKINGAAIIDIAPTILYIMGLPIPSDMDGKVLKDAIDSTYLESNPISNQDSKTLSKRE